MPLQLSWQLLAKPDARNLPGFWLQLAEAAEYAGLDALVLPSDAYLPEPLTLTAALAARTRRLQLVAGVRIDMLLPAALAGTTQSLQAICGNRLQLYLQGAAGARLTGDQHLAREREFVQLLARLLHHQRGEALHHQGEHYHLEHAELGLRDLPAAALWLGAGHDETQVALHAAHCLIAARPPRRLAEEVQRIRALGRRHERRIACHAALRLIARASEEEAWDAAARLLPPAPDTPAETLRLHAHPARSQELYPNLWQARADGPLALVGSYSQVASRIAELQDAGLDGLVLSSEAPIDDCLRLGEEIRPLLRQREADGMGRGQRP